MSEEFKRKFLNLETSFASILQISTGHMQQQQQQTYNNINGSYSFPPGTSSHYPSNIQSTSMYSLESDPKATAKEPTRQISYFGDLNHFDEIEFHDFFI